MRHECNSVNHVNRLVNLDYLGLALIKESRPEITNCSVSGIIQCNADDELDLRIYNNCGSERQLELNPAENWLSVHLITPGAGPESAIR